MVREKEIRKNEKFISTGYYDHYYNFIYHSFNNEPAIIYSNGCKKWYKDNKLHRDHNLPAIINGGGNKFWYVDGERYWIIEKIKYTSYDDIYEIYRDKIFCIDESKINFHLVDKYPDIIAIGDYWGTIQEYLILDDTQRNEVILRYG